MHTVQGIRKREAFGLNFQWTSSMYIALWFRLIASSFEWSETSLEAISRFLQFAYLRIDFAFATTETITKFGNVRNVSQAMRPWRVSRTITRFAKLTSALPSEYPVKALPHSPVPSAFRQLKYGLEIVKTVNCLSESLGTDLARNESMFAAHRVADQTLWWRLPLKVIAASIKNSIHGLSSRSTAKTI